MQNNNEPKSPRTSTENSPIRNLFKKAETPIETDLNQKSDKLKNKSFEKNSVNSQELNSLKTELDIQKKKSETELKSESNSFQNDKIKSQKSESNKKPTENYKEINKSENKKTDDITDKKTDEKSEKNIGKNQSDMVENSKEFISDKNLNKEDLKHNDDETEKEALNKEENTKKHSPFKKFKSKIKNLVMAMKQPEEESQPEIEDIFSTSGRFERTKNANPLDADEEFRENVIYSAPKEKEENKNSERVISVKDILQKENKTKSESKSDDKHQKDDFEIIEDIWAEKNNRKNENKDTSDYKNSSEKNKDDKQLHQTPLKSEISEKQNHTEKAVKVETSKEIKISDNKPNQNTVTADKNTDNKISESKNISENKSNANVSEKIQETKPIKSEISEKQNHTEKAIKDETSKEIKISDNKPNQNTATADKNTDNKIFESKNISENKSNANVSEKIQETKPIKSEISEKQNHTEKAVKTETSKEIKISDNKPNQNTVTVDKNTDNKKNYASKDVSENKSEYLQKHNNPKIDINSFKYSESVGDKLYLDNIAQKMKKLSDSENKSKQNNVNQSEKTDISNTDKKLVSKIEGDDGVKILPWTPPKKNENKSENINEKTIQKPDTTGKNLDEGNNDSILIYHYNKSAPFIVMAGKFTKTLRSEYEEVRKFNSTPLDDSVLPKVESADSTKKKNNSEVKPAEKHSNKSVEIPKQTFSHGQNTHKDHIAGKPTLVETKLPSKEVKQTKKINTKNDVKISEIKKPVLTDIKSEIPSENKSDKKQKIVKKSEIPKNPKKKSKLAGIFKGDEDYEPEDDKEIIEEKPQLDDYTNEKDAEEIRTEILENFRHVLTRTGILLVMAIISIVFAVLAQCIPSLFNQSRNGWIVYAIINFIIFSISVVVSRVPIVNGILPLKKFKGNSDTGIAIASFAVAIQSIIALFLPKIFVNGTLYIYTSIVVFALFLNSMGKLLIILRVHDNFRFLTKPRPKYAGKIYTDIRNAEKMSSGLPLKTPIIAYMKKSKFMNNFLKLSYAPDPSEEAAAKFAPYAAVLSLLCGIAYGVITLDFAGAVSSFALSACITTPICCLLAVNIPLKRLCHNTIRGGSMITSYETVKQFCDTNTVMIDSSMLYPRDTVTLSGMKAFKESKINDAITAGAAIMFAVNGTMSYIFENIIQGRKDILPKVDSVIYEDGMGLVGWIEAQRVLIGNRRLLEAHNITPPEKSLEEKYLKMGNEVTYISMGGELIAMFILTYTPNREIIHELRNLEDNGVSFIVRTVDPNITQENIAEKFCLFHRCIKVLPTSLGNICHEAMSSVDEQSRAYLVTRGKISSFARAVAGCIRVKSNITLSIIIQYIAIILGILIVTFISFVSGFQKLGCLEMLLYIGFWAVATIIIPLIKK